MRLIKPNFEILEQPIGEEGIYKQIERVGRICYKSEDKITEDSYKKFVEMLKSKSHGAMLEHGTVYLKVHRKDAHTLFTYGSYVDDYIWMHYEYNHYSKWVLRGEHFYITTNLRVLVENNWLDDLKYLCEPTEYHEKRVTAKFICDRGVSHEFVRHRVFSFAQESTRYCNYSKDKFGNELTFIIPNWVNLNEGRYIWSDSNPFITAGGDIETFGWDDCSNVHKECDDGAYCEVKHISCIEEYFVKSLQVDEYSYIDLLNNGCIPQEARQVLPNALKTELVMTGFVSDWEHFFKLRNDKDHAHPDAHALAHPLYEEFIKRGYLND